VAQIPHAGKITPAKQAARTIFRAACFFVSSSAVRYFHGELAVVQVLRKALLRQQHRHAFLFDDMPGIHHKDYGSADWIGTAGAHTSKLVRPCISFLTPAAPAFRCGCRCGLLLLPSMSNMRLAQHDTAMHKSCFCPPKGFRRPVQ
jgi:hypothetical protein